MAKAREDKREEIVSLIKDLLDNEHVVFEVKAVERPRGLHIVWEVEKGQFHKALNKKLP